MKATQYFRKGHVIYQAFRGEEREVEVEKDGQIKTEKQYFPHEHEGECNFDEIVFYGSAGNFASINAAKRKSRELQTDGLGMGQLRVLK